MDDKVESGPVILQGTPASAGIATGPIEVISHRDLEIPAEKILDEDVEKHINKAIHALSRVRKQLQDLKCTQKNREIVEVLDAQIQIVKDPELLARVRQFIESDKKSAGFALYSAFNEFIQLMQHSGQDWIKDRVIDLKSLRDKIIQHTTGTGPLYNSTNDGAILFAEELSPTELIEFSESKIAAIVMQHGGTTSHAVIIAQSLGIPCVVGVEWRPTQLEKATMAAVDAETGEVIIGPDENIIREYKLREKETSVKKKKAIEIGKLANQTSCNTRFYIRGNVEFEVELQRINAYRAEGIGLLRTETLFLRQGFFDVDSHTQFYKSVLAETDPYPVTIRLLDIGGDKLPGINTHEQNPFLGWRGIRMLLDEQELLDKQLRSALYAASDFPGRVQLLIPMISDVDEIVQVKSRFSRMKTDLAKEGIKTSEVPLGIMVEIPSIALQAAEAAKEADFFSIGSNDLTQYTLAADRGNERVSRHFNSNNPAVWKLIKMTFDAAEKASIPISVCGEMAGKPFMAAALLGLGIRDLSMNPASIPEVKKLLCNCEISDCKQLFDAIINASGSSEADKVVENWRHQHLK
jgi:phosphoenolpyruvate-protein phosphotransferase (PTS system enzyme I)